MTEKQQKALLKEALKEELAPLLIGVRNDLTDLKEKGLKFPEKIDLKLSEVPNIVLESKKGDDGHSPKIGIDYFTDEEKKSWLIAVTPVKGKDYFTEADIKDFLTIATPKKGVDYFDGKTPIKGTDYFTDEEVVDFLIRATPRKGIHYFDGEKGEPGTKGADGTEISAEQVRDKLESLKGSARLSVEAIKGLDELLNRGIGGVLGGSGTDSATIPSQTGQAGKYLTTNGSSLSWSTVSGSGSQTPYTSDINANSHSIYNLASINTSGSNGISNILFGSNLDGNDAYWLTNWYNIYATNAIYQNNQQVIDAGSIGGQSVNYANEAGVAYSYSESDPYFYSWYNGGSPDLATLTLDGLIFGGDNVGIIESGQMIYIGDINTAFENVGININNTSPGSITLITSHLNTPNLPSGTLISPPAGLSVGDLWQDTTTSAQYPIIRVRKT